MTLYVVERWLARLSVSPHARNFVLKGGVLLAAYELRRPTADLDALARSISNDARRIVTVVSEVARMPLDDGVEYQTETATSRIIRDNATYAGVRIVMDTGLATATVRFRMDVSFGDPIIPAPRWVSLPALRPGMDAVRVLGYPVETVLAEKIATAIALGPANTRVRDFADIYTLTGIHAVTHSDASQALRATAEHRGTSIQPLSSAVGDFADLRRQTFAVYRASLGNGGTQLPADLRILVSAVAAFADPLAEHGGETTWQPAERRWTRSHG